MTKRSSDTVELTGLELLEAVARGDLPQPPIGALFGMRLVEVARGRVLFEGEATDSHLNLNGVVHGGFAATLLDSAMGCAVQSTLDSSAGVTTVSMEVKLVRQVRPNVGAVVAEGLVIHRGRSHATAEGWLREKESNTLLAHGITTCFVFADYTGV